MKRDSTERKIDYTKDWLHGPWISVTEARFAFALFAATGVITAAMVYFHG